MASVHTSTQVTPYLLMFGRERTLTTSDLSLWAHDTQSYADHIQSHLPKMYELVELNLTEAAFDQKWFYDRGAKLRPSFAQDSHVWLSIPTAGKLDPKWERGGL